MAKDNRIHIYQAHDKFFRTMFDTDAARDFFKQHLPASIKKELHFETLKQENGSFVEADLSKNISDILYSAEFGEKNEKGYLYIVIEHQSTVDSLMAFRLFKYTVSIIDRHIRNNKGKKSEKTLPCIYPLVFYNGKKPYNKSLKLLDLFDNEAYKTVLKKMLIDGFELVDTNKMSQEALRAYSDAGLFVKTMKYVHEHDGVKIIQLVQEDLLAHCEHSDKSHWYQKLQSVLCYVMEVGNIPDPEAFMTTVQAVLPDLEGGEIMMSLANQLRHEGMRKGMEKGMRTGRQEGLQKGLEKGMRTGRQEGLQKGLQEGLQKGLEKGMRTGRQEGMQKGLQKGLEKGMRTGLQEGMLAGMRKVAKNLLTKKRMSRAEVAQMTGLSEDQLKNIE